MSTGGAAQPSGRAYGGNAGLVEPDPEPHPVGFRRRRADVIVFDLHTGASAPMPIPRCCPLAVEDRGASTGAALFGPAMSVVLTGEGRTTDTGIAATATAMSRCGAQRDAAGAGSPLVIECTLPGEQVINSVREDNWLHLTPTRCRRPADQGPAAPCFRVADPDWQAQVLAAVPCLFQRALTDLERQGGMRRVWPWRNRWPESGQPAVEVRDLHKHVPLEVLSVDLVAQPGEVVDDRLAGRASRPSCAASTCSNSPKAVAS